MPTLTLCSVPMCRDPAARICMGHHHVSSSLCCGPIPDGKPILAKPLVALFQRKQTISSAHSLSRPHPEKYSNCPWLRPTHSLQRREQKSMLQRGQSHLYRSTANCSSHRSLHQLQPHVKTQNPAKRNARIFPAVPLMVQVIVFFPTSSIQNNNATEAEDVPIRQSDWYTTQLPGFDEVAHSALLGPLPRRPTAVPAATRCTPSVVICQRYTFFRNRSEETSTRPLPFIRIVLSRTATKPLSM